MKHSKLLVWLAFVALAALIPTAGIAHHGGLIHEDGALETANWEEAVQVYGVDGSGGGTSRHVGEGGGTYREISVNRSPITADPSNATHLYQF